MPRRNAARSTAAPKPARQVVDPIAFPDLAMSRSAFSPGRRKALAAGAALLGATLLAGCSAESTLGEAGSVLTGRTRLPPLAAEPPAGRVTVQVLPFTGIPVTIGDGIYQHVRMQAKDAAIDFVNRLDEPALYRIQGHFVALGHESSTTVVFTYDIYDPKGARVHRIVGQETAKLGDGDPWSGVDTDAQTRIATRFTRAVKAWLTRAAT